MRLTRVGRSAPRPIPGEGLSRRALARGLVSAALLPLAAGCARFRDAGVADGRDAALLLPLSGEASALGGNMARAASLVVTPAPGGGQPPVYDTRDTVEGAGAAAEAARAEGARLLLGPLRADQTPVVLAAAGRAPVVTFSNDDRLVGGGAFVMGVTPAQSVDAAFSYARAQGVRRVAVVGAPSPLAEASIAAAQALAAAGGLTLTAALRRDPAAAGLGAALRAASGGALPDAVFLPDGGPELLAFADALAGEVQLLGGVQWGIEDAAGAPALEGAWFAAPPPADFGAFLDTFEARFGESGGVVTALGHDAARMAAELGGAGRLDRAGLTREEGFVGALGRFRFRPDGRCERDLAVLTIEEGRIVAIGEVAGT